MSASPVRAWLAAHTPISANLLESSDFVATLAARMRARRAPDEPAYLRLLDTDPEESIRLQCAVAVPETWLFRYRSSYEFMR
ncbi:MAG: hypothetical protein KDA22_15215, partial [Phycisphaerales bacterium]|nr:hypothetical protein [Phycisphaerales bacterium]